MVNSARTAYYYFMQTIMNIILTLLPVILIGSYMFSWIVMITHALTRPIPYKPWWLVGLIFVPVLGVISYYLVFYWGKTKPQPLYKSAVTMTLALFVLMSLIILWLAFTAQP